jgi:serine/threonine-protein kinase
MNNNLVGQTIQGRYYVVKQLGRGGIGVTFVAQDRQCFDSYCVVKQLKPRTTDSHALEVARRLFNREAEIMNRLGHSDRIPRLLAYFEHDNDFFLVQELIIGHDLSQEIIPGLRWSEAKCIALLQDILEILLTVQQHGVIHRDLKPSNLMRRDRDGKIVLIDFGSVKQVSTQIVDAAGVKQTVAVGTKSYMPMEQMMGHPGFYSDIYALGVIIIQALTGIHPQKLSFDESGEIVWRNKLDPTVNYQPPFLNLLDKMARYRYQERYATAEVVLSDLKQLEADRNNNKETIIITTRSSCGPQPYRHNPKLVTEVANNHQAERVIVAESTRLTNLSTSPQAAKKSKLRSMSILAIIGVIILLIAGLVGWLFTKPKDEPEIMQTLSNSERGFSIDYPKAWSKQNRDDMFSRGAVFLSPLENDADRFREKVSILVEDLSADMSLADYTRGSIAQIKQLSDPNVAPAQTVNLGKETARRVVYNGLEDGNWVRRMQTWTVVGDRAYVITYTAQPESYDSYLPTVEKMIESFTRVD